MAKPPKDHTSMAAVAPLSPRMIRNMEMVVPRTELLETLSRLQIPFPKQLPDITPDDAFPTDVTAVGSRDLRKLQSYWAAQYARVNALLGITRGEMKAQERATSREKDKRFHLIAPERSSKVYVDAIKGRVLKATRIGEMERNLDNLIRLTEALEALTRDFSMYVSVIEREMMYRMAEMKNNKFGGP